MNDNNMNPQDPNQTTPMGVTPQAPAMGDNMQMPTGDAPATATVNDMQGTMVAAAPMDTSAMPAEPSAAMPTAETVVDSTVAMPTADTAMEAPMGDDAAMPMAPADATTPAQE